MFADLRASVLFGHRCPPGTPQTPVSFEDITARCGIDATLRNSATAEKHQIETMPGGVAAFDYDGDGLLDLFFTNGAPQPALDKPDAAWWNRLYRNRGDGSLRRRHRQSRLAAARASAWAPPPPTTITTATPTSSSPA